MSHFSVGLTVKSRASSLQNLFKHSWMLGINLRPELKKDLHILHIFIHENKDKGTYGFHNEKIAMVHGSWSIPMDFPWEMFGCFSHGFFPRFHASLRGWCWEPPTSWASSASEFAAPPHGASLEPQPPAINHGDKNDPKIPGGNSWVTAGCLKILQFPWEKYGKNKIS